MRKSRLLLLWLILPAAAGIIGAGLFASRAQEAFKLLFASGTQRKSPENITFHDLSRAEGISPENLPLHDITAQISAMTEWVHKIQMPKEINMINSIHQALDMIGDIWIQARQLVDSGNVKPHYSNGLYIANWKSPDNRQAISFTFTSESGRISECRKKVFSNEKEKNEIKEKGYILRFRDVQASLEWCSRRDGREVVGFYSGNRIREYLYQLGDNTWYEVRWDENGKIIFERTRTYKVPQFE